MKKTLWILLGMLAGCEKSPIGRPEHFEPLIAANRNRLAIVSAAALSAEVGWLEVAQLSSGKLDRASQAISKDAIVRAFDGDKNIYVLDRKPSDGLTIFSKETLRPTLPSISLSPYNETVRLNGTDREYVGNVQDLALDNKGQLLLTRYNAKNLLKVDPATGNVTDTQLSLGNPNWDQTGDPFPEMARIKNVLGTLWIGLQCLNGGFDRDEFKVEQDSYLVRLHSDNSLEATRLPLKNVVTDFERGVDDEMVVGLAGSYFDPTDGGILRLDRRDGTPRGVLVGEKDLGGSLAWMVTSLKYAFALVWTDRGSQLVRVDLKTAEVKKGAEPSGDDPLYNLVYDDERGIVFVANGNFRKPGVEVIDAETLQPISRINLEFPPMGMALTD